MRHRLAAESGRVALWDRDRAAARDTAERIGAVDTPSDKAEAVTRGRWDSRNSARSSTNRRSPARQDRAMPELLMTTYDPALERPAQPTVPHYDRVQRFFHWSMAAVILTAMLIGLYCAYQAPGTPVRKVLLEWHKSLGMTALVLIVWRIAWRLAHAAPPYAERLGRLNHMAASAGHLMLYGLMLFMPLTGYLSSGAGGYTLPFFWLFQWPRLVPFDKGLAHAGETLHYVGAWAIYLVVGTHLAAVAWHQLIRRDTVLGRMWPRRAAV